MAHFSDVAAQGEQMMHSLVGGSRRGPMHRNRNVRCAVKLLPA